MKTERVQLRSWIKDKKRSDETKDNEIVCEGKLEGGSGAGGVKGRCELAWSFKNILWRV